MAASGPRAGGPSVSGPGMIGSGQGACVLLVEDEFLICAMMEDALIKHGFEVYVAATASEALEHLTCGAPCDLLLTDLNLGPGMDGAALAQRVRELRPGLQVVYASGSYNRIDQFRAVPGATFIPKPYNPDRLCAMLCRMQAVKH
jgi:two-component system OmpR family response regulator